MEHKNSRLFSKYRIYALKISQYNIAVSPSDGRLTKVLPVFLTADLSMYFMFLFYLFVYIHTDFHDDHTLPVIYD